MVLSLNSFLSSFLFDFRQRAVLRRMKERKVTTINLVMNGEKCQNSLTKFIRFMFFADNEEEEAEDYNNGTTLETTLCL